MGQVRILVADCQRLAPDHRMVMCATAGSRGNDQLVKCSPLSPVHSSTLRLRSFQPERSAA